MTPGDTKRSMYYNSFLNYEGTNMILATGSAIPELNEATAALVPISSLPALRNDILCQSKLEVIWPGNELSTQMPVSFEIDITSLASVVREGLVTSAPRF
jgi:hypothetical protein